MRAKERQAPVVQDLGSPQGLHFADLLSRKCTYTLVLVSWSITFGLKNFIRLAPTHNTHNPTNVNQDEFSLRTNHLTRHKNAFPARQYRLDSQEWRRSSLVVKNAIFNESRSAEWARACKSTFAGIYRVLASPYGVLM